MFQRLKNFFRKLFHKKHPPVIEELPPGKIDLQADTDKEPLKEVVPKTWEEKHALRKSRRARKKAEAQKWEAEKWAPQKTDKHGIPLLAENDDLSELFIGKKVEPEPQANSSEKPQPEPEENFAEMLEKDMGKSNFHSLLQEKRNSAFQERRLPTSELIKAYPKPQDEIDLHGCTAREAELRAEYFIQSAHWKGARTLRIIVGKGLHSEGKAVLPDIIEKKLSHMKKDEIVLTFKWENHGKLKSGAMIVYLT